MENPGFLVAVLAVLSLSTLAQQNPSASTPMDAFLGKWKLSVDKSSQGPTGGAISIEPAGKKYRITVEIAYPDGFGGTSWTVTDMKGWASPVTRNFNRLIAEDWHVKRETAESFTITSVFHVTGAGGSTEWRYAVSPDGKTLTRRVVSGGPSSRRNQVLVFEKAP